MLKRLYFLKVRTTKIYILKQNTIFSVVPPAFSPSLSFDDAFSLSLSLPQYLLKFKFRLIIVAY